MKAAERKPDKGRGRRKQPPAMFAIEPDGRGSFKLSAEVPRELLRRYRASLRALGVRPGDMKAVMSWAFLAWIDAEHEKIARAKPKAQDI